MKIKHILTTLCITFILSFLLQGISDPVIFTFSNWRKNNLVNILHLWLTFLSTYYLFSFIVELAFIKFNIGSSKKLIATLIIAQVIAFIWVIVTDVIFYNLYYKTNTLHETTFFEFDIPLALVILTIGSVYFYQKNYIKPIHAEASGLNTPQEPEKKLEVFKGSKSIYLNHSDISLIHLSEKIVWVTDKSNKTFQTNLTLTELTDELSSSSFFRLNRQVIVSKRITKGYNRLDYQKIEVLLDDGLPTDLNLVVSKYNAPDFKKWLADSA